jgi:curved DNA-binding protein CbpA
MTNNNNNTTGTYYDTLGVDPTAEATTIRKAYLKLSLQHHPDKNPDNVEDAKAKFVVIGQAYETLKDPQLRHVYDLELKRGNTTNTSNHNYNHHNMPSSSSSSMPQQQSYDNYANAFDETVAGMSEAELAAAMGTASAVAAIVGSMVGSRFLGGGGKNARNGGGGGGILGAAGSIVGSMVASEMAASSVRALHQQSVERVAYQEKCRQAVERGEPIPEGRPSSWEEVLQKTMKTVKGVTNNLDNDGTKRQSIGNLWNIAKAGVVKAAAANNNNNNKSNASTTGHGY